MSSESVRPEEIERFRRLFLAHLAQDATSTSAGECSTSSKKDRSSSRTREYDATAALERFQVAVPSDQQAAFGRLAEQLRRDFHATKERQRQAQLYALLVQLPPFPVAEQDVERLQSGQERQRRAAHVQSVCRRFATRQNVGVRPFFAALKRLLEAQANDRQGRPLQWLLDDAVLMEAGGDEFMRSAVWLLKAVLLCSEYKPSDASPFDDATSAIAPAQGAQPSTGDPNVLRIWTLSTLFSNPEYAALARLIPSHVLPQRGRGSAPAYADGGLSRLAADDEERQSVSPIDLPTGSLRYAPMAQKRDQAYRGGWLEWLYEYVLSFVYR